jgi:precorrin-4 methylase
MGGIFLAVHSLGQLEKAGMMETVNEFCPLKLLLRNPWADTEKYKRALKMNDKTAEIYSKLHQTRIWRHALSESGETVSLLLSIRWR